jgi:SAM-dependent methyltransferase
MALPNEACGAADVSAQQRVHYDRMAHEYQAHYSDEWSVRYRRDFINRPLLRGLDLRGKRVLDAMCGSGDTSAFLVEEGALVTGLDNSPTMVEKYLAHLPGGNAVCGSITDSGLPDESFDAVVIVGGLHHLHPHLDDGIVEIHRLLRPGGHFCFGEPPAGSVLDRFRRIWYRLDRAYFAANEEAIDIPALAARHAGRFRVLSELYMGNLAYLLVFSSMIFRMPRALKDLYSRPLLAVEPWLQRLQGPRTACFAISQWQKR